MPLPNSSPAEDSRIYQLFQGKKVEDFSADDIDQLRDTIFFQAESEDLLRRLILFGMASGQQSFSGPIGRTGEIKQQAFNEANEGDLITLFKPGVGEVWVLTNISASMSGGSSGISLFLADQTSSSTDMIFLGQESSTGVVPWNPSPHTTVYITSDMFLVGQGYSIDTGETSTLKFGLIRVR
jgi:hypothetical protein